MVGKKTRTPRMDLSEFEAYLHDSNLSDRTVECYVSAVRRAYDHRDPVTAVRQARTTSSRTVLRTALRRYGEWLAIFDEAEGHAILEALRAVPRMKQIRRPPRRPLENEEWRALMDHARHQVEPPVRWVLILLFSTGLRSKDVLDIERYQVREALDTGTLYLEQKGGEYRPFPVGQEGEVREALVALVEGWQWDRLREVVSKPGTKPAAAYVQIWMRVKEAARALGIDEQRLTPHLFRATAAVQLLRRTKNLIAVQKFLGHKSLASTEQYLRYIDPEELQESWRMLEESRRKP